MTQLSTLQKRIKGKRITDTALTIKCKDLLYPLLMLLTKTKVHYRIHKINTYTPLPNKPIIFVGNHSAFPDTPIILRVTERRSYIFSGKQNLAFLDWVFFVLNGVIWVDRKSKEDMSVSKDALAAYLKKGQSILWFPEGTWNLTANQLMLHMKWGIIDIAKSCNAQIIPVGLDYDRERMVCSVMFADPMHDADFEDKSEAIHTLRDTLASLRWELMCNQPTLHRSDITPEQLQEQMYKAIHEYPPLDWEYEKSCIYHPYPQVEIVPQVLIPRKENAFLFRQA